MRTMLDIEDSVLAAIEEIARQEGRSAGAVASTLIRRALVLICATLLLPLSSSFAAQPQDSRPVGTPPPADAMPRLEFAFEARVTLAPAVVLGETGVGSRQYIPITGGNVSGPRFRAEVVPGGWDYQLRSTSGCNSLTADYFWKAEDGTVIHILNEELMCAGAAQGERNWLRPKFEAPKGPHEWMTRATFVASLETEQTPVAADFVGPAPLRAIRIRFYQVK